MIDKKAVKHIEEAVAAEMKAAINTHGNFHSHNEAWAVLKEEYEEIHTETKSMKQIVDVDFNVLWSGVTHNIIQNKECRRRIEVIRNWALRIAFECIQVAAMCDKWELYIAENEEEEKAPNKQLEQCFMHQFTEIDTEMK